MLPTLQKNYQSRDASKVGFVKVKYQPQSWCYFAKAPVAFNLNIPAADANAEAAGEVDGDAG